MFLYIFSPNRNRRARSKWAFVLVGFRSTGTFNVPSSVPNVTAHPSTASVPTSYYLTAL